MRVERVVRRPQAIVGVHAMVEIDELSDFLARAYVAVCGELARLGVRPTGPPVALYTGDMGEKVDVVAGLPVAGPVEVREPFIATHLPGGPTVEVVHHGAHETLPDTYDQLTVWLADRDLEPTGEVWEEHVRGPHAEGDPSRWCTRIVHPLA